MKFVPACAAFVVACLLIGPLAAEEPQFIPRRQDRPPGPPLSPEEAIAKMTVPPGFSVELVASEPDLVNPVAMCFDEQGRIWVTESLEYPRRSPGPGRDRVKVLEDTTGDGKADKVTIFAEGLNIPSGIQVGHGGVWVANSPNILFLQDTDGDLKADKREVVVTGFGRTDTHELPNSLTWGPDGWLYGLNGVFNRSHVKHQGKEWKFTCAMFRIHPKTHEFQLFAEGTSNPWGIAWDEEGSAFLSACVIDHLWHITESGYYQRQAGAYPPFTWRIGSIVKHKHQKAAYCGITYFDSDAYPPEYRGKLYMGNIHGGCINCDALQRDGSTYFGTPRPDFLTANDVWFMPVVQKTGPDGCLYVLDWYDRYHCYQDANRDPQGIDRLKGRLYRIRYQETPRRWNFDLSKLSGAELIELLGSPNVYDRQIAGRLLAERDASTDRAALRQLVLNREANRKARLHGLWALISTGRLDAEFHRQLLQQSDATIRQWAVRAAGNFGAVEPKVRKAIAERTKDQSPDVLLQLAIAANKIEGLEAIPTLVDVLEASGDDKLIPHIVWENLHPLLEEDAETFLALLDERGLDDLPELSKLMPRVIERILGRRNPDPAPLVLLIAVLSKDENAKPAAVSQSLRLLAQKVQTREIAGERLKHIRRELQPLIGKFLADASSPNYLDAALLAVTWKDDSALQAVREVLTSPKRPQSQRQRAFDALVAAEDQELLTVVDSMLAQPKKYSPSFRSEILAGLGRFPVQDVATVVLKNYQHLEEDLQPKAIELLTQRSGWAKELLVAIGRDEIPHSALNVNQVRKLLSSGDEELVAIVKQRWGTIRTDRNPQREQVIAQMKQLIRSRAGDPFKGIKVYNKVCAQCHQIYGEGQKVGPDITRNGRASFEQLLSNVFDPSLVIGAAYQARTVITVDGRVLTGLLEEDSEQRVVLNLQGGKKEIVPREEIDELVVSPLSLMPEGLEKQLKEDEIIDLFSFLTLDKHPSDPTARRMPGVYGDQPKKQAKQ